MILTYNNAVARGQSTQLSTHFAMRSLNDGLFVVLVVNKPVLTTAWLRR